MHQSRRRLWSIAASAMLVVGLAACSSSTSGKTASPATESGSEGSAGPGATAPAKISFGAMVPLSGDDSAVGTEMQRGIEMALAKINSSGELGSTKLSAIYRDNPGTPADAVTNFNKLNSINHVAFSFTSFSSATAAIAPLATKSKVLLMNPGATSTSFKGMSPYLFSDIPLGDAQVKAILSYAHNNLHIDTLGAIYSNDAQGDDFKSVVPEFWKSLGGTFVGSGTVTTTQTNFGPVLTQIKSKKPQALFIGFFGTGQGDLVKQAAQMNFKPTWLAGTNFANQGALQIAGANADGAYSAQVEPAATSEASQFASAYKAKYHAAPTSFAQLTYSGTQVLAQAVKTLLAEHKQITSDNLRSKFLSMSFDTVNGAMKFSKDGTVEVPIAITVYQDGAFKALGTVDNGSFTAASGS